MKERFDVKMLETLMTSTVRAVLMKHFLGHPQERFYLRQLERLLDQSLTPLRRELIRLTKMGLLKEEREANLKFFRLNEEFKHLEELKRLVADEAISKDKIASVATSEFEKRSLLLPVVGCISLVLLILQVGLFYMWTHPVEDLKLEDTDYYVMSSGKTRLESGGFGGWQ
jgi:DNA-binding transcriptional ArsR family regulator